MNEPAAVKNECILTHDSIFLHSKQNPLFIASYFLIHIVALLSTRVFYGSIIINVLLFLMVFNPFVISFWYQLGYGEQYKSHWSINLGLFRLFCVNNRFFTVTKSLSKQVVIRLDAYRKLNHE